MLLTFVAASVLLTLTLRLVLAVVTLPIAVLVTLASKGRDGPHDYWSATATQALVCIVTSGMLALLTAAFLQRDEVVHGWIYVALGFANLFLTLAGNYADKRQSAGHLRTLFDPTVQGTANGAWLGVVVGIPFYFAAVYWPSLVGVVPGASWLIGLTALVSDWLAQFLLVRLSIGILVLGYLLNATVMLVMGSAIVGSAAIGAARTSQREPPT